MVNPIQQALIVDDSKTARVTLKKMLEKHGVEAEQVESGEQALSFLQSRRPDVIFMDHMMPGMDGFAAVKAIKSNSAIASIPIVMHTTQHGEIYLGQARALGAVDLLSKPTTHEELTAVLDRVRAAATERQPAAGDRRPATDRPFRRRLSSDTMEIDAHAIAMAVELEEEKQQASGQHAAAAPQPATPTPTAFAAVDSHRPETPFWGTSRQWLLTLVWLLPILWLLYLYLPTEQLLKEKRQQAKQYLDVLEWSLNQRESYDFGEVPLSGDMVELLQGLLPRLERAGFRGVIQLEGHIGEFCLSSVTMEGGTEISILPEPDLPLTACAMIGYAPAQAVRESVRQSEAFGRYLRQEGLLQADAAIRVDIVPRGSSQPKFAYPEELEGLTTGDWNAIALSNNRIRIALIEEPFGAGGVQAMQ